jgi:hypothetical protein
LKISQDCYYRTFLVKVISSTPKLAVAVVVV